MGAMVVEIVGTSAWEVIMGLVGSGPVEERGSGPVVVDVGGSAGHRGGMLGGAACGEMLGGSAGHRGAAWLGWLEIELG